MVLLFIIVGLLFLFIYFLFLLLPLVWALAHTCFRWQVLIVGILAAGSSLYVYWMLFYLNS